MKGAVYFDQTFDFALFLIVGRLQSNLRYQSTLSIFIPANKNPTSVN